MPADFQPTLTGRQVMLRPVAVEDWAGLFAAAADPAIWAAHPVRERYLEPVFREFFDSALASRGALTILDRESGEIIGSSRYFGHDPDLREVEIGWTFLARSAWGGTYNREVKDLMLDHAFRFVDTVIFLVGDTNMRSQRAMEKIGGVLRSEARDRSYGDLRVRHVVYEICKARWTVAADRSN